MFVEQFVMAYGVEQDRLRAFLPQGFISLRPVLRINGEILDNSRAYLELNTPVEHGGKRGWLNVAFWEDAAFERDGETVRLSNHLLDISFTGLGRQGSCPAEKDNDGCFFLGEREMLRLPEAIASKKEYCHCVFRWKLPGGAAGESTGETLPAFMTEQKQTYPASPFTVDTAAVIPCTQVLGAYRVAFARS